MKLFLSPLAAGLVLSAGLAFADAPKPDAQFADQIRPVLTTHCVGCHGAEKPKGDLRLDNRTAALKGEQRTSYFRGIALADSEWRAGNIRRAGQLLDESPEELRHFEWHYLRRMCRGGVLTLRGPTRPVASVAFSPDGRQIVSAATGQGPDTGEIRLHDAVTGQAVLTVPMNEGRIAGVAFSPDGRRIASASHDKTVRVWDAETGRELLTLRGHEEEVQSVAFSPDGKWIASGGGQLFDSGTVRIWDAVTGQVRALLEGHHGLVRALAVSPDGKVLATGDNEALIRLWFAK